MYSYTPAPSHTMQEPCQGINEHMFARRGSGKKRTSVREHMFGLEI